MFDTVPNFGLHHDLNWRLASFIDQDILSELPLTDMQIDYLSDKLNWQIVSKKDLPRWLAIKYANKINWPIFLNNNFVKSLQFLIDIKKYIKNYINAFNSEKNKNTYYTNEFLLALPDVVDWAWCCRWIQLDTSTLLKYWNRMLIDDICQWQQLSVDIMEKKLNEINWRLAVKTTTIPITFIEYHADYFDWDQLAQYQQLPSAFWDIHMLRLDSKILPKYQKLNNWFILKHHRSLNIKILSQYQNFDFEFLTSHMHILDRTRLLKNNHFNKPGSVQIINHCGCVYVVEVSKSHLYSCYNNVFFSRCIK